MKLVKVVLSILVALVYCSASEKIDVSITAVGNPGVGKSFLLNLLINIRNHFAHETRPDRVTEKLEPFVTTVSFGDSESKVSVINIPGILDLQPELLVQNKQKFDDAMKANDQQVILFVIGNEGGRPRTEDLYTFKAVQKAYQFKPESLMFVFNKKPAGAQSDFESKTVDLVRKALNWEGQFNALFLESFDQDNNALWNTNRSKILQAIKPMLPTKHEKVCDIEIDIEAVKRLREEEATKQHERQRLLEEQAATRKKQDEATRQAREAAEREAAKEPGWKREINKNKKRIKSAFKFKF